MADVNSTRRADGDKVFALEPTHEQSPLAAIVNEVLAPARADSPFSISSMIPAVNKMDIGKMSYIPGNGQK
eukprot:CAMPEP_0184071588 /NCGR_PEP_ID=MMETSP0957-20130417/55143_1 /TAXON_ID=627963 /ORGANISM="Aplanochytrium sp, Strain PBS07" /LENGTH=70 /DNA_ID=CAMNT_0026372175 /DNA_START=144 /DNA_END=353 /DNA_ORIENTATION=-